MSIPPVAPAPGSTPESTPVPSLGAFERVIGVFFEPGRTLADVARVPGFILPLLILIVCATGANIYVTQRIGLENIVRSEIAKSPRTQDMPKEQMDRAVEMGVKFGRYNALIVPIAVPLVTAVMTLLFFVMANFIFGGKATFNQLFSGIVHASLPPALVTLIVTVAIVMLKDPSDIDVSNVIAANLGLLIPAETNRFLHRFATSLDLFSFWQMTLIAMAISAATRFSLTKSLITVGIPWLLYVLVASAWAAAF